MGALVKKASKKVAAKGSRAKKEGASDGTVEVAVLGANGRMGEAVIRLLAADPRLSKGACVSEGDPMARLVGADVVVDFSAPSGTRGLARLAAKRRLPIVVGTTGLDRETEAELQRAAKTSPVFVSSNMSIGVFVLGRLVQKAEQLLGPSFDVEIVEVHHRKKADAPSGTALLLGDWLRRPHDLAHGRRGRPGPRPADELGMHAVRGGDVIGDHTVHFLGDGERIELTHRATNRDLFAHGALRVARVLARMAPGRYAMGDVIDRL